MIRKIVRHRNPKPLPRRPDPPAVYPCKCKGCLNYVPFKRFTCCDCFIKCDKRSHRVRKLKIRRQHA